MSGEYWKKEFLREKMTIIKSAQIIDGTGKPPFRADVLLKDDKISAIGSFPNKKADTVINGLGYYLVPGFIDVNTDSDHYLSLFTNPSQKDFLLQGVTTIIGGHCGSSLAPLLYGTLESIRKWTDINQINVDWHTIAELFKTLGQVKLGVNFGTLAGHSTIRRALIGEDLRDLTESELKIFQRILNQALEEGALGFSTGLGYAHSRLVPYNEIKALLPIVAKRGGVYTTHLRDETNCLLSSINETIKIARETGVKTLISHIRPLVGYEKEFENGLKLLEKSATDLNLHFDTYPFDTSIVPIYTLLPLWAQNGGLEIMAANLSDPSIKNRIIPELPNLKENDLVVAQAIGNDYLVGKTLGEFAANRNLDLKSGLLELMTVANLKALIFYKNVNLELVIKSLTSEKALLASNAASLEESDKYIKHERGYNTFPRYLEINKTIPLETAIKKITLIPAEKFNLRGRGVIKEGNFADLALISDNKIQQVLVSGQIAVSEGKSRNIAAGRILRGRG